MLAWIGECIFVAHGRNESEWHSIEILNRFQLNGLRCTHAIQIIDRIQRRQLNLPGGSCQMNGKLGNYRLTSNIQSDIHECLHLTFPAIFVQLNNL